MHMKLGSVLRRLRKISLQGLGKWNFLRRTTAIKAMLWWIRLHEESRKV